jgi:hypothetical protein
MAGYTRQSSAQILSGEIVSAAPINAEYNQIVNAFDATTGHKHEQKARPLIVLQTQIKTIKY